MQSIGSTAAQQPPGHAASPLSLRARWRQWWWSRIAPTNTLTLTQRNVYILPTGAGWMLALTLLLLLVASINFQLNLGYLLTFLLVGCVAVSIYVCHSTLRGLSLHLSDPAPQFMGSASPLEITLTSARRQPRHAIGLALHGSRNWVFTDVPGAGSSIVQVSFEPTHRGLHGVPTLKAETRYPLGTFRVWTIWRPAAQVLIYPQPENNPPPLPPGEARAQGAGHATSRGVGEFDGVRAYRRGDPLKLVVWKKAAKSFASGSDELVSRDAQQLQQQELWLDLAATGLLDREARISRLTAWVIQADRLGVDFGLRLPGQEIEQGNGAAHRHRCLEALALC
ncbi:DUF58 domain-containing protein [Diaphorobacter ruginosibacter]|uniref:DUF58 domain-containing protein n=1 Tax=Diaphorobacter ruginosibacter TaxID=1715720 RepID=A0A7G9RSL5_9BURK|nr:DUF58 domain-containing protein [Diaphorobacter ruginosibacter]QNN58590.1 DUF58 domain-containing protein [Diaphorobacter ruginosibacter]